MGGDNRLTRGRRLWPVVVALVLGGGVALLLIINSPDERTGQKRGPNAERPAEPWYGIYDSFRYGDPGVLLEPV